MDICRPFVKPNCSECTILLIYGVTFFAIALVNILYATSHSDIGLKFFGFVRSASFLGIKVTFFGLPTYRTI